MRAPLLVLLALCGGSHASAVAPAPAKRPQCESIGDVARTTFDAFCLTGFVGASFTAMRQSFSRMPRQVIWANSNRSGMRWGKLSAGFAGGQAAACYALRRDDGDLLCSLIGAACGGAMAAECAAQMPGSIIAFVSFSYILHKMSSSAADEAATAVEAQG